MEYLLGAFFLVIVVNFLVQAWITRTKVIPVYVCLLTSYPNWLTVAEVSEKTKISKLHVGAVVAALTKRDYLESDLLDVYIDTVAAEITKDPRMSDLPTAELRKVAINQIQSDESNKKLTSANIQNYQFRTISKRPRKLKKWSFRFGPKLAPSY